MIKRLSIKLCVLFIPWILIKDTSTLVKFKAEKKSSILNSVLSFSVLLVGDDRIEGLLAHNALREIHHSPLMQINEDMSDEAQEYATQIAKKGTLDHSTSSDGENLAMGCKKHGEMSFEEAVKMWLVICDRALKKTEA